MFPFHAVILTHAGYDAVNGKPGGGVIEARDSQTLGMILLLFEDEGRVFLLGDVDIVTGVCSSHDVTWSRIQEDAFVVFPLHSNQTHSIPRGRFQMDLSFQSFCPVDDTNSFLIHQQRIY